MEGLVHNIWKQRFRWIYYLSLLLHVIFVVMLTCLALLLNNPTSPKCEHKIQLLLHLYHGFFIPPLGELILSGQFDNITVEITEVNISSVPDRYSGTLIEYFERENISVTDNLANVSNTDLCSSATLPIRDILTTLTSVEFSCAPECGQ